MEYVSQLYTLENLENTEYYQKVKDTLRYLELIRPYEKEKQEVAKEFRNIESFMVIPKNIYEENLEKIEENLEIINQKNSSKAVSYTHLDVYKRQDLEC